MKKYLYFDAINVEGPKKKILEFNANLQVLSTQQELDLFESLLELIKNKAFYHSSKVSKQGFEIFKKMLTKFPSDKAFPVLDLYRMFLLHPHSSEHYKVFETALEYLNILVGHLKDPSAGQPTQLVALRCLVNLFNNSASLYCLQQKRQWIVESASPFLYTADNKNIRQAAATLLLNYSILFLDKPDAEGKIQMLSAMSGGAVGKENDVQIALRMVTMLGNIQHQDAEAKEAVQAMVGEELIKAAANASKMEGSEEKTVERIKEIVKVINKQ